MRRRQAGILPPGLFVSAEVDTDIARGFASKGNDKPNNEEASQRSQNSGLDHLNLPAEQANSGANVTATEDMFLIDVGNNQHAQVRRTTVRRLLQELRPFANTDIKELPEAVGKRMRDLIRVYNWLHAVPDAYKGLTDDMREVFKDIPVISPGTVAAYFQGCYTKDNFPGPAGCNPKCANSFAPDEPSFGACEDLVLYYRGGKLHSLNNGVKINGHCFLHVDETFQFFEPENIKSIVDTGITSVTLLYGGTDGNYKEIKENLPVSQLPVRQLPPIRVDDSTKSSSSSSDWSSSSDGDDGNTNYAWIWVIFVIVIILLLLLVLYYR